MDTETQREEGHVMAEAEIGVMPLQAKGIPNIAGNPPEARLKAWNRFCLRASGRN